MLAEGSGITVEGEIAPNLVVKADPVLLQQAIHNLVANGVKYNHAGGRLVCTLSREGEAAEVRVSSTGPAIPPTEWRRVFERFYRSGNNVEREGSGLGLSLTREIVAAHGGEVAVVESTEGGLTTFRIRLPLG